MIIGVTGYPNSGKDTVADYLVKNYGFTKISINEPMRKMLTALNPIVSTEEGTRVAGALSMHGYELTKEVFPEYRRLLQRLGKEASRDIFGEDFWIDQALRRAVKYGRAVFNDVRYENEAQKIRQSGGVVFKVFREGTEPKTPHASDMSVQDYICTGLYNDATVQDLYAQIDDNMLDIL